MIKKGFKKIILQRESSDCGIACLATITKYYNGFVTLEKLRELSGTSKQGTTLLGLYQAAQVIGFDAQGLEVESVEDLKEILEPAILHVVINGNLQHYIVYFGFDFKGDILIGDPAKGIITLTKKDLDSIWKSKALLKLTTNNSFIKAKEYKNEKWNWFKKLIDEDFNFLVVALSLGLIISILGISTAIFSQRLIDKILPSGSYEKLIIGLILVTFLLIIKSILNNFRGHIINNQNREFNNRVITKFYTSIIHLPKSFFDTRKVGDIVARMNDTRRIQNTINALIGNFIIDILIIIITLIAILIYSIPSACSICISFIVFFLIIYKFHKLIVLSQKEVMQAYALSESNFIDTIQGVETIKSFGKESFFSNLTKEVYALFQLKVFHLNKLNIKYGFWSELTSVILLLVIFTIASFQVLNKELLIGEMVAILSLTGSIIPSINRISLFNIQIQEAKVAFDRMYEFSSIKPEPIEQKDARIVDDFHSLQIKNIDFRFTGRKQILHNLSISIKKGEFVAIIGESGSGKSTLTQIMQAFYKPENGTILVNEINQNSLNIQSWRNIMGVVPQQIKIFNGTLIENICIDEFSKDLLTVQNFCKHLGFDKFFSALPNAYYTILGEEGVNISGGQQQLVALARALYKKPKILILDEATSAMDRNTENFIIDLLLKMKGEITIVMITHRIKAASKADKIYILENGAMAHSGTPQTLLQTDNFFSLSYKDNSLTTY